MAEEDVLKTAFVMQDGCYESLRMPFGMKNSGAMLVRGMRQLLSAMDHVRSYIDNLIVYTEDWKSHLLALEELLQRASELGCLPHQMFFEITSVGFLGIRLVVSGLLSMTRTWRKFATPEDRLQRRK